MGQEKDLLKKELGGLEKKEEIEKFAEDAELLGHEDIVELAKQKLLEISKKAESAEQTSESQVSQIGTMEGSVEEVNNRTVEVDKKIKEVKTESEEKIKEVQNENKENSREGYLDELTRRMKSGEQVYLALKQDGGEDAINRKIKSFDNKDSRQLLTSINSTFTGLSNASDEEVKNSYLKYFEPQTSKNYLGSVLTALDSKAFQEGFFNARNGKSSEGLSEDLSNLAKIAERLINVGKKVEEEKESKNESK